MAMTSYGSDRRDAFAPFWNPSHDTASGSSQGSRDMHLDVLEVRSRCCFCNTCPAMLPRKPTLLIRGQHSAACVPCFLQSETNFEIRADLPGMNKNDIKVHVDRDVVTVSVEKENQRKENKEERGVRQVRSAHTLLPLCLSPSQQTNTEALPRYRLA